MSTLGRVRTAAVGVTVASVVPLIAATSASAGGRTICESMGKGGTNKLEVCLLVNWNDADPWQISGVNFTHQVIGGDNRADNSKLVFTPILRTNGGKTYSADERSFSSRTGYVSSTKKTTVANCSQYYGGNLFNRSQDWYTPCHYFGDNGTIRMRVQRYRSNGTLIDDFQSSSVSINMSLK